jgi:anthranilate synthase component II
LFEFIYFQNSIQPLATRILVFDNYDSFTYNLVHLVEKILHTKVDVFLNDKIELSAIDMYDKIILSPGPGLPADAGILMQLLERYKSRKSILGVCLGHQAIALVFGGLIFNMPQVMHGIDTPVYPAMLNGNPVSKLFEKINSPFNAARYHSWAVDEPSLPPELEITARDERNCIMGLQHREFDLQGVQFHPESILTPDGEQLMRNWLSS